jgi:hypothetical protein
MEYIGHIESVADMDFAALADKMKIEQGVLFLADFCSLLYEKAVGYYEKAKNTTQSTVQNKAFKIGHVLVNSSQAGVGVCMRFSKSCQYGESNLVLHTYIHSQ